MSTDVRLYWEVTKRAFQRQLAYRTANFAGLATNAFFGYLRAAVFVAVFRTRTEIGGYDLSAAVTYTWLTQGMIMIVSMWSWWEVEQTIRSGDVVSDLSKPFSYTGFWLARDLGRAAYYLLMRCCPVLIVGQLLFGLRWPHSPLTWLALGPSLFLAVCISFGWRFLLNLTAFWTTEARGLGALTSALVLFLNGFVIPIEFFPAWLQHVARALPFAGTIQVPADVFLEQVTGWALAGALGIQLLWAAIMLGLAQALVGVATRRVVTQGG